MALPIARMEYMCSWFIHKMIFFTVALLIPIVFTMANAFCWHIIVLVDIYVEKFNPLHLYPFAFSQFPIFQLQFFTFSFSSFHYIAAYSHFKLLITKYLIWLLLGEVDKVDGIYLIHPFTDPSFIYLLIQSDDR